MYTRTDSVLINSNKTEGLKEYVRPGLNIHQLEEIKKVFDTFANESGYINPRDIKNAIKNEGVQAMANPLYQIVSDLDTEGQGLITFQTFVGFLSTAVTGNQTQQQLRELFKLFDDEKTGYISLSSLRRIINYHHFQWEQEDLVQMVKQADLDKDGRVSFDDFVHIMTYRPSLE